MFKVDRFGKLGNGQYLLTVVCCLLTKNNKLKNFQLQNYYKLLTINHKL